MCHPYAADSSRSGVTAGRSAVARHPVPRCGGVRLGYEIDDVPVGNLIVFGASLGQDDIADLAARIRLEPQQMISSKWGAELAIRLDSGRTVECAREDFLGTPDRPMPPETFAGKFHNLTGAALPDPGLHLGAWLI